MNVQTPLQLFQRGEVALGAIITSGMHYEDDRSLTESFTIVKDPEKEVSEVPAARRFVEIIESDTNAILATLNEVSATRVYNLFITFISTCNGINQTTYDDLALRIKSLLSPLLEKIQNQITTIMQKAPSDFTRQEANLLHEKLVSCALNRDLICAVSRFSAIKLENTRAASKGFKIGLLSRNQDDIREVHDPVLTNNQDMLKPEEQAYYAAVTTLGKKVVIGSTLPESSPVRQLIRRILEYQESHPERQAITERLLQLFNVYEWMHHDLDVKGLSDWLHDFTKMIIMTGKNPRDSWNRFCLFRGLGLKFHDSYCTFASKIVTSVLSSHQSKSSMAIKALFGARSYETCIQEYEKVHSGILEYFENVLKFQTDLQNEVRDLTEVYREYAERLTNEFDKVASALSVYRKSKNKPAQFISFAHYPEGLVGLNKKKELPEKYVPIDFSTLAPKTAIEKMMELRKELKKPPEALPIKQLESLRLTRSQGFKLHARVSRWFDPTKDPFSDQDYVGKKFTDEAKHFIRAQHTFEPVVDPIILKHALNKSHWSVAGAMKIKGVLYRGKYSLSLNEQGELHHRHFQIEDKISISKERAGPEKKFFQIDFLALEEARLQRKKTKLKPLKPKPEGTYEIVKQTECFVKIRDFVNSITIYLYPSPTSLTVDRD